MFKGLMAAAFGLSALAGMAMADEPTKLVTIVTEENPQTQLMAMVLTMQAAQKGAVPHVMLCGPAGDIALKQAPDSATAPQPPKGISPQGLMTKIMGLPGAKVEVCAIYLPARGQGPEILLDGITVAKPGAMAMSVLEADASLNF